MSSLTRKFYSSKQKKIHFSIFRAWKEFHFPNIRKAFFEKILSFLNLRARKFQLPKYKKNFFWRKDKKFFQRCFFYFSSLGWIVHQVALYMITVKKRSEQKRGLNSVRCMKRMALMVILSLFPDLQHWRYSNCGLYRIFGRKYYLNAVLTF